MRRTRNGAPPPPVKGEGGEQPFEHASVATTSNAPQQSRNLTLEQTRGTVRKPDSGAFLCRLLPRSCDERQLLQTLPDGVRFAWSQVDSDFRTTRLSAAGLAARVIS